MESNDSFSVFLLLFDGRTDTIENRRTTGMKTVFIINPDAGKGKGIDHLQARIRTAAEKTGQIADIYMTKAPQDAERFAKSFAEELAEAGPDGMPEAGRLIACGGDGTFNEVLNGVMAAACHDHVALGLIPTGTGNDFVRNFPEAGDFLDPAAQLSGQDVPCDAIRYRGILEGKEQTRYCANMFNVGLDCNVVDTAAHLKRYPLIAGSFAYLLGVAINFIRKKGANLKVELDGKTIVNGPVLLTAIANGGFCGGGVHSAPMASTCDGRMDVNIIYNVSRFQFLKKFPYYAKGTHMELPDITDILYCDSCTTARLTPLDGTMRLCTDGVIVDAGTVEFEMAPGAFRMILPAK